MGVPVSTPVSRGSVLVGPLFLHPFLPNVLWIKTTHLYKLAHALWDIRCTIQLYNCIGITGHFIIIGKLWEFYFMTVHLFYTINSKEFFHQTMIRDLKNSKKLYSKNKILTKVYHICTEKSQMVFLGHLLCNFISFSFTYSYC